MDAHELEARYETRTDNVELTRQISDFVNPTDMHQRKIENREEIIKQLKNQVAFQESQFRHEMERMFGSAQTRPTDDSDSSELNQ